LLVPGESEYQVIPYFLKQFGVHVARPQKTEDISFPPEKGDFVLAPKVIRQIQAACRAKDAKVILLFDGEKAPLCPGDYAKRVRKRITEQTGALSSENFEVICMDHCIENWILADPNVFTCKLFKKNLSSRIGNRSDCKPAIDIIAEGFGLKHYDKTRHLPNLAKYVNANSVDVRRRSPSLDKFLRELGV